MTTLPPKPRGILKHPQWYKDAVIYECRARSFFDSNGDGVGDIAGLEQKLPYLQDLGITALWLLPLCPSPGRDDGYDISDYYDVHPEVGTLDDFRQFIESAHRHGIRVITELVLNHTSDAHPWFQRARRAEPGSVEREFYVWSDTSDRYRDARIIFKDFEPSNWTWDPLAKAYYWHRFFSHQPDLNFENEAVQTALFEVVDFWFDMGVDGLRLDAVPYLFEEEGSNCENLPRTHAFLKRLRAHVDGKFEQRMLLAEANQWPEDAAAYFGDGDECHMNFHFPIMPRMFMAIQMEDRFPIIDIMDQTPQLHANCQWAMFLRNHDELTLEMVTDEERDYMYRVYAHESAMRINLGIRRRLAPLVGNDRRKMELLNGLLFSLPGTPVSYYGDEIGMGDNVFPGRSQRRAYADAMELGSQRRLFARQSAASDLAGDHRPRVPLRIAQRRSAAKQHQLAVVVDQALIALRKHYHAFGWGTIEFLSPSNPRVLAFIREYEDERILVVANLSRFVQFVELDLGKWKGMAPVELFGRTTLPHIGEVPYLLTLGGHAFYWFSLEAPRAGDRSTVAGLYMAPNLESASLTTLVNGDDRALLEEHLPAFLSTRGWYGGHTRRLTGASVLSAVPITGVDDESMLLVIRADYSEGESENYCFPLTFLPDEPGAKSRTPEAVFANVKFANAEGRVVDALEDPDAARVPPQAIIHRLRSHIGGVELIARSELEDGLAETLGEPRMHAGSGSNSTVQYGDKLFLKLFRRVEEGIHPDLDVASFLAAHAPGLSPRVVGSLDLRTGRGPSSTIAVLQEFVPNEGTAWELTRRELVRFYERVLTAPFKDSVPALPHAPVVRLADQQHSHAIDEAIGPAYLEQARLLGKRTAEMHLALASAPEDPAFAAEAYSALDRRSLYQSFRNQVGRVMRTLRSQLPRLPVHTLELAQRVLAHERETLDRFEPLLHLHSGGLRIRCHGDFNLKQALWTGKDFVLVDFDGGNDRAITERRRKRSPLRDVASMILSFHYAAGTALRESVVRESDAPAAEPWAEVWEAWVSATYVRSYLETAQSGAFLPTDPRSLSMLVDRFILARAFRHLGWELGLPTDRVAIPLQVIARMISRRGDSEPSPPP